MCNSFIFGRPLWCLWSLAGGGLALAIMALLVPADAGAAPVGTLVVSAADVETSLAMAQSAGRDRKNALVSVKAPQSGFGSLVRAILYAGACVCQRFLGLLDRDVIQVTVLPAPIVPVRSSASAALLFGPALLGLVGIARCRQATQRTLATEPASDAEPAGRTQPAVILLISPDAAFTAWVDGHLHRAGYLCRPADSVSAALACSGNRPPALILRDCRVAGWEMLRTEPKLRSVPIMGVIPSGVTYSEDAWLEDFEYGMDGLHDCADGDRLLVARVTAFLRRSGHLVPHRGVYRVGRVELDADLREVRIAGRPVRLSAKPFAILETFMRAPSRLLSRAELVARVWGPQFAIGDHALDVHVHALRQALDRNPDHLCQLVTIKGVGFKLKSLSPVTSASSAPDVLPMAVNSLPLLPSGEAHVSNAQRSLTPSPSRNRRNWLRRVPRHRRARPLRRKPSVRHLGSPVSIG